MDMQEARPSIDVPVYLALGDLKITGKIEASCLLAAYALDFDKARDSLDVFLHLPCYNFNDLGRYQPDSSHSVAGKSRGVDLAFVMEVMREILNTRIMNHR